MAHDPNSHPLDGNPNPHPLSDPPQKPKTQQRGIPIPMGAQVPFLSYALLIINVGIFALRYIAPDLNNQVLFGGYLDPEAITQQGHYYRLFTAMFLHANEAHILFNGIALYYIGANIERLFGHVRFAIIYVLGGLLSSVLMLLAGQAGLGASGAIFAIWGAEAVFYYHHRALFGAAGQARLRQSLMLMLVNFLAGFSANALNGLSGGGQMIGNLAHLGGLIGGAILTWFISPRLNLRRDIQTNAVEIVRDNPLNQHSLVLVIYSLVLVGLVWISTLLHA